MAFKVYVQKVSYFHHILLEGMNCRLHYNTICRGILVVGYYRDPEHMDSKKDPQITR